MEGAALAGGVAEHTDRNTLKPPLNGLEETENSHLANLMKEKTPMCLVNELARYNKIQHQYRLTGEQGPAHKKLFTVTLKLGEEEYSAEGASIKKAQHFAASNALKSTTYKKPLPKASRINRTGKSNITPTVELNALAMKRGEPTVYTFIEVPMYTYTASTSWYSYERGVYTQVRSPNTPPVPVQFSNRNIGSKPVPHHSSYRFESQVRSPNTPPVPVQFSNRNFGSKPVPHHSSYRFESQKYCGPKSASLYKVTVKVGDREFHGEGLTARAARHDAAGRALDQLRNLPLEPAVVNSNLATNDPSAMNLDADSGSGLKSPISLVHELSLKRNLSVVFDVISEDGPPHMRTFITRCCVGDKFESLGEGNGKKVSKKRAAEKMLEQLKLLPPTTTVTAANCPSALRLKRKPNPTKKKSRNLIKVTSSPNKENNGENTDSIVEINPISRLMQLQQAKKEKEPIYILLEERSQTKKREFVMEVTVGENSYVGIGPNKKIAKRNAAEGLLIVLGYSSGGSANSRLAPVDINRKAFIEDNTRKAPVGGSGGRQLVPGLLLMSDNNTFNTHHNNGRIPSKGHVSVQATAAMAKDYLNGTSSMPLDAISDGKNTPAVRPKDQLLYLAQLLGFRVQFSDFPKGNHSEFLSLVSLSTDPPQVCHGSGMTTELSHDQAALTALQVLSELGLDSVTTKKESSQIPPNADGMYGGKGSPAMKTNFINGGAPK